MGSTSTIREFIWDYRNRLVEVIDKNAAGNTLQEVAFAYDMINKPIAKSLDTLPSDEVDGVVTYFIYDRDNIILEYINSDATTGVNQPLFAQRYLHGINTDKILAQEDATQEVNWYLSNHLGTIGD